jgi:hypothetical protein
MAEAITTTKLCSRCGERLPEWRPCGSPFKGTRCQPCRNEDSRRWREANPEKRREVANTSAAKAYAANPEKFKDRARARREERLAEALAREAEYRERNRAALNAAARQRYEADPKKHRQRTAKWRADNPAYAGAQLDAWRKTNTAAVWKHRRKDQLKRRYGLTLEKYAQMVASQSGMCAICRATPPAGKTLFVDHDHGTGAVRELLCHSCNVLVGYLEHRLAPAAREYLRRHGREG